MEALNQKERSFAEENHGLIYAFLNYYKLPDTCASALIHSRGLETRHDGISHCVKGGGGGSGANFLVEKVPPPITEVCVNDRGFTEKDPQVSSVAPTLRAENHGNHPKVIEERSTPPPQELERAIEDGVVKAQRNGMGTFIGISPTLLSTDYKGPPAVIEKREGRDE